jgi:hypothetical protein
MRLLSTSKKAIVLYIFLRACSVWAEEDPAPGSKISMNKLVESYRSTVVQLLEFEATTTEAVREDSKYKNHKDQLIVAVLQGLDNVNTPEATRLIVDLSAVYFGETVGPYYSCVVKRKGRLISETRHNAGLNSWCIKNIPNKFCLTDEQASSRLQGANKKAKKVVCDLPLY